MPHRNHNVPASFNPEHAPVIGTNITEAISLDEVIEFIRDRSDEEIKLVVTDGTWINGIAKSAGLLPKEPEGEPDVPTN